MNKHSHRLVFSRTRGFCIAVAETAKAAGKAASGERSGRRDAGLGAAVVLAIGLLAGTGAQAQPGPAGAGAPSLLPGGGKIVNGTGSIGVSGAAMTVHQSTPRLVADWQSFSIGAGNSVRFVQPSTSAVALNRVTGNEAERDLRLAHRQRPRLPAERQRRAVRAGRAGRAWAAWSRPRSPSTRRSSCRAGCA